MSLTVSGSSLSSGGTSVAAPFVTGAIALLCSEFPRATADEVRQPVAQHIFGEPRSSHRFVTPGPHLNFCNSLAGFFSEQFFVRVDVTEEFPFLVSPLQKGFIR